MGPTLAGILFDAVGFPLATIFIISAEFLVILSIAALVISADCTRFVECHFSLLWSTVYIYTYILPRSISIYSSRTSASAIYGDNEKKNLIPTNGGYFATSMVCGKADSTL